MKRVLSLLVCITIILSLAACTQNKASVSQITVTDASNTEVSIDKIPNKIISLVPSITEILYALNSGDKVTAVSDTCNYPEEVKTKAALKSGAGTNIENIIADNPDVVFIGKMSQKADQVQQLRSAGVKVVVTDAQTIDGAYSDIAMVGKIVGKNKEANDLTNNMKKQFDEIKNIAKNETQKKVYVELSPLDQGLWTCGQGTFLQELFNICNIKNVFDDLNGWQSISEEQVIKADPDIILTTCGSYTASGNAASEIMSRKNWQSITAVKNGAVYDINADTTSRPAPRLVDAARELIKKVYDK